MLSIPGLFLGLLHHFLDALSFLSEYKHRSFPLNAEHEVQVVRLHT